MEWGPAGQGRRGSIGERRVSTPTRKENNERRAEGPLTGGVHLRSDARCASIKYCHGCPLQANPLRKICKANFPQRARLDDEAGLGLKCQCSEGENASAFPPEREEMCRRQFGRAEGTT